MVADVALRLVARAVAQGEIRTSAPFVVEEEAGIELPHAARGGSGVQHELACAPAERPDLNVRHPHVLEQERAPVAFERGKFDRGLRDRKALSIEYRARPAQEDERASKIGRARRFEDDL